MSNNPYQSPSYAAHIPLGEDRQIWNQVRLALVCLGVVAMLFHVIGAENKILLYGTVLAIGLVARAVIREQQRKRNRFRVQQVDPNASLMQGDLQFIGPKRKGAPSAFERAALLNERGQYDDALAELAEVFQLDPNHTAAHVLRGSIHAARQQWDDAMRYYDRAIELDPNNPATRALRCNLHIALGNAEQVLAETAEIIRLAPHDDIAYILRNNAYQALGRYGEAIKTLQDALAVKPERPEAHSQLARLYACCPVSELRDGEKAVELATRACELTDWREWTSLSVLSAAHAEAGDFRQAIHWAKKTVDAAPDEEKPERQKRLALFESAQPYRLPAQ